MTIEKITSKIMRDGELRAKKTLETAEKEREQILSQARKDEKTILSRAEKEGIEEKEKLIVRKKSVADIDAKKMILQTKQDLIGQCFEAAIDEISSLDRSEYIEFLVSMVKRAKCSDGAIILNKKDRMDIGEELMRRLAEDPDMTGFRLSERFEDMRGGLYIQQGCVYINCTIEAIMSEEKDDLVADIAGMLFS